MLETQGNLINAANMRAAYKAKFSVGEKVNVTKNDATHGAKGEAVVVYIGDSFLTLRFTKHGFCESFLYFDILQGSVRINQGGASDI